jgi:hypothetical protein
MKNRTKCAVPECPARISGYSNLCDSHRIPGAIARLGNSTMVITSWLVQHGEEQGLIALNDFALGDLFGGAEGFLAKLEEQGFTYARNLATPEELQAEIEETRKLERALDRAVSVARRLAGEEKCPFGVEGTDAHKYLWTWG